MAKNKTLFHKEKIPVDRPILREAFWGVDWLALRSSLIYYGVGARRGDGSAVILVPGFLGTDYYFGELYFWLWRIGYKPYLSGIGWNANCLDRLGNRLMTTVEKAREETQMPVHLIGHSLGGILARAVAAQRPEKVSSVIALGSPFRGIRSHPLVLRAAARVRERILREQEEKRPDCYTGFCECAMIKAWESPFPETVSQTAVYTKSDGIVDWRVCLDDDPDNNFEVTGTHCGLVVNPQVYRIIANRLRGS